MSYTKRLTIKLEAGNNYVYPVTLTKQSLTVGSASIADWDNVEVEDAVSMKYQSPIKTITDKADVRKYDYLMKDGSFIRVDVNDLDKLTDSDKANIAGVVFWTKAENAEGCPDLSTDGQLSSDYQHGLVVSVNQYQTAWMSSRVSVGTTVYNVNKLIGYSNTKNIKEHNASNSDAQVLAVSVFTDEADVKNTSGWYLPSSREVVYLYGGTTMPSGTSATADNSNLDNYLTVKLAAKFWTSDEYNANWGRYVMLQNGSAICTATIKEQEYSVRPICAF
jgi:hypothetical protein